jgi:hypothetical protein
MVIGAMVDLVKEVDPMFFEKVGLDTLDADQLPEARFRGRWPRATPSPGVRSAAGQPRVAAARLVGRAPSGWWPTRCATFGLTTDEMDDDEAIERVMNPAQNPYRSTC